MILGREKEKCTMKRTVFFHNPKAGDSDHEPKKLLDLLGQHGFSCQYRSVRSRGWRSFDEDSEVLIAAGGDGCVRKVIEMLLRRTLMQRTYPLAVIPLGTANNFARTLGIDPDPCAAAASVKTAVSRKLDVGLVEGFPRREFFIEGIGAGIFPALMEKAKNRVDKDLPVEEKLLETLKLLEEIVRDFSPLPVTIIADGSRYEEEYLMVEIMNTRSIGPNLVLAENADPSDGRLDMVLIPAGQRARLLKHIRARIAGEEDDFSYPGIKAEEIKLFLPATRVHIDDKAKQCAAGQLRVYIRKGTLDILVPGPADAD